MESAEARTESEAGPREPGIGSLRVGFALLPKKVSRYLTPSVKATAFASGIELCLIDYNKPLASQGPFHAIIHKLRPSKEWECSLQEYSRANPNVRIIDSMEGIRMLRNRVTMLSVLQGRDIVMHRPDSTATFSTARVQAPVQLEITEDMPLQEAEMLLLQLGMHPPLLVKPVWTDGREGSHGLAVVHDLPSLSKLLRGTNCSSMKPPVVVQQFVEHGGVLHKVYVLGDTTVVCKRPSLGDNYLGHSGGARRKGITQLPRISCTSHRKLHDLDQAAAPDGAGDCASPPHPMADSETEMLVTPSISPDSPDDTYPPEWVTHSLAQTLRERLGVHLFNFDLLCPEDQPSSEEQRYVVVDINYFPGVDKIPNFEEVFVQFLRSACSKSISKASPGQASS